MYSSGGAPSDADDSRDTTSRSTNDRSVTIENGVPGLSRASSSSRSTARDTAPLRTCAGGGRVSRRARTFVELVRARRTFSTRSVRQNWNTSATTMSSHVGSTPPIDGDMRAGAAPGGRGGVAGIPGEPGAAEASAAAAALPVCPALMGLDTRCFFPDEPSLIYIIGKENATRHFRAGSLVWFSW